ncbi:MAG: antibiotic biosynthesis monooxygenase [Deltaproteobacteria bacterium]|nr:antibiotic biosynthesis monooxygenase [Deltaproteobacteria bacterium]
MILVANRIYVAEQHRDTFERLLETRAGLVDGMPGFLGIQLLRPTKAGEPYLTQTFWSSRDDFESWLRSEAFVKGHARMEDLPKDIFPRHSQVEVHEVFHRVGNGSTPTVDAVANAR